MKGGCFGGVYNFGGIAKVIEIVNGSALERIPTIRELFLEYAAWLGIDLCFQGFDEELAMLPGKYAPPLGRILLALDSTFYPAVEAAGVVALKDLGKGRCEMKRLWVREPYRGSGLGRTLVQQLLDEAKTVGYKEMVLDTLKQMEAARALYAKIGFTECRSYYKNPHPEAIYMKKKL
jgi:putative acetyltransferase